jgi:MFS family permease
MMDLLVGFSKKPPSYVFMLRMVGALIFLGFMGLYVNLSVTTLVLVTFLWGIYSELYSFSVFDFIQALSDDENKQAFNFGVLDNAYSLGALVAPMIASLLILTNQKLVMFTGIYLVVGFFVVFNLFVILKRLPESLEERKRKMAIWNEIKIWLKIRKKINTVLSVLFMKGMSDGALTGFVPIMAMNTAGLGKFGGFVLMSIFLPITAFSGVFGDLADKNGKKNFILTGILLTGLALLGFGFSQNIILSCLLGFIIGTGISMYSPASLAVESIYIKKHKSQETRVVGETGIYYNVGFIIGSSLCGLLVAISGSYGIAFGFFGIFYLVSYMGKRKRLKV